MYNVVINKNISRVLGNLQHSAGTYDMYDCELKELLDLVLFAAPEAGYSNARVGELARVIVMLQRDLKILAARDKAAIKANLDCFYDGMLGDSETVDECYEPESLDEPEQDGTDPEDDEEA